MSTKGKIHIYTGDGKGKTTAGLGLAIRAIGNDLKVGIIFFDKGGDYYNEHKILDKLKGNNLDFKYFGEARMQDGKGFRFENKPEDFQAAQAALDQVMIWMKEDFDLLILDEINTTVKTKLLKLEDLIYLVKNKPADLELVMTGRYCPPEIIDLADLVTEMKLIKHYISTGQAARPGIEY
jgi:cob(I)alamin adenosyltransferase